MSGVMDEYHSESTGKGLSARTASSNVNHAVSYRFRKRYAAIKVSLSGEEKEIHLGIILNDDIRRELSYGKVEAPVELPEKYQVPVMTGSDCCEVQAEFLNKNPDILVKDNPLDFVPGDMVIVSEGPLAGLPAIVSKVEMGKRGVKIKVHLFERDLEMRVPAASLKKTAV